MYVAVALHVRSHGPGDSSQITFAGADDFISPQIFKPASNPQSSGQETSESAAVIYCIVTVFAIVSLTLPPTQWLKKDGDGQCTTVSPMLHDSRRGDPCLKELRN